MASALSRRPGFWLALAVALLAATLAALMGWTRYGRQAGHQRQVGLLTVPAVRRNIVRHIEGTGTLRPTSVVHVGSLVSGVISTTTVQAGDHVDAGQVIATVEDTSFRESVVRAESALAAARLRDRQAQDHWVRQQALARLGYVSEAVVEDARVQHELAEQDVAGMRSAVASARLDLAHCVIRSPISGLVLSRDISAGQSVASAFQVPDLFTIVSRLDPLEVVALFAEADLGWVRSDAHAAMTVPAWPGQQFDATVTRILDTPESRQGVVMFPVLLRTSNAAGLLRPGMTAFLELHTVARDNVLTVPNAAVAWARTHDRAMGKSTPVSTHLYGSRDGDLIPLAVHFGESDDENTEITPDGPMDSGERIVWKDAA